MMKWLRKHKQDPRYDDFIKALKDGEPARIEQELINVAPHTCETLEEAASQLADKEQANTVRYWQRSRWGQGGESQALSEMRRVFKQGPKFKEVTKVPSKLPPLYPD